MAVILMTRCENALFGLTGFPSEKCLAKMQCVYRGLLLVLSNLVKNSLDYKDTRVDLRLESHVVFKQPLALLLETLNSRKLLHQIKITLINVLIQGWRQKFFFSL